MWGSHRPECPIAIDIPYNALVENLVNTASAIGLNISRPIDRCGERGVSREKALEAIRLSAID